MTARWNLMPNPPSGSINHAPYWSEIQNDTFCVGCGEPWPCLARREAAANPTCKCSHLPGKHGFDRRGRFTCFGSSVCGCAQYREKTDQ